MMQHRPDVNDLLVEANMGDKAVFVATQIEHGQMHYFVN